MTIANAEKVDRNTDKETSDAAECMTDSSRDLGVGGNGYHCDGSMGTKNDCESALRKDNEVKKTKKKKEKKNKKWHWRDIICKVKLTVGLGYTVSELCGKCNKCNRIFAACGCIPCPMRFSY